MKIKLLILLSIIFIAACEEKTQETDYNDYGNLYPSDSYFSYKYLDSSEIKKLFDYYKEIEDNFQLEDFFPYIRTRLCYDEIHIKSGKLIYNVWDYKANKNKTYTELIDNLKIKFGEPIYFTKELERNFFIDYAEFSDTNNPCYIYFLFLDITYDHKDSLKNLTQDKFDYFIYKEHYSIEYNSLARTMYRKLEEIKDSIEYGTNDKDINDLLERFRIYQEIEKKCKESQKLKK
jgi:hypothetical protein